MREGKRVVAGSEVAQRYGCIEGATGPDSEEEVGDALANDNSSTDCEG